MLKLRKKLLSAALAATIAVSAAQVPVWSEEESTASSEGTTEVAEGAEAAADGIFVTEEEAFANMKLMAENSNLALYVNEDNYTFVVENKLNGYKWWSSFYNTDEGQKVAVSRRSTLMTIEVVGTESKAIETARAYDSNVKKQLEKIENGVKFTFTFNKYDIIVPLEITLEDDHFTATVPSSEIIENRPENDAEGNTGYQILGVNVLENFGGTDRTSDGLMIVPDGSGAVINYNNNAPAGDVNTYEGVVYGRDLAVGLLEAAPVIEHISMPVIGRITEGEGEDNGLVLIASDGDEYSIARAAVTGQNVTDLNNCWFEFSLRTQDKYFMGSDNEPLAVYEQKGIKAGDVTVSYYPISGEDLSYVDIADVYRDYLINDIGVTPKAKTDAPFYLTLYGGTVKEQSIIGFPVEIQTSATTYKEALEIINELENRGISNIKIIYEDFNEAGIVGKIAASFEYSSLLGGKGDYDKLYGHIKSQGYEIFPSCDIMEFENSGNGYSFTLNASKQITNSYATQTPFELAFGLPHETKNSWTI